MPENEIAYSNYKGRKHADKYNNKSCNDKRCTGYLRNATDNINLALNSRRIPNMLARRRLNLALSLIKSVKKQVGVGI